MTARSPSKPDRERGVVLALVMILALLLSASIVTFSRRAVIDTMIVRNRDAAANAEALARGGLRIATAVLIADRITKGAQGAGLETFRETTPGNTSDDLWNQLRSYRLVTPEGATLRIEIQDAGGRLNLNAVVPYTGNDVPVDPEAEEFLRALIEKVIDEMPIEPGEKSYDLARDLAQNLIDYMDTDRISTGTGADEDDYYLHQKPASKARNGPLLSVEELGLVQGFDVQLMQAMRAYVTVYPVVGAAGINLNTAPPHVLALVYNTERQELVSADTVGQILNLRAEGQFVCTDSKMANEDCVSLLDIEGLDTGSIFPAAALPAESDTFTVTSRATAGEVERTLVAVVDRSQIEAPQLLFWRMQ